MVRASHPVPSTIAARERLVLEVGLALHRAGAPAHRLEDAVGALARRLDLEVRVFSTPTAIYASFGDVPEGRTVLLRAEPGGLDLGRLADVDALVGDVVGGRVAAPEGVARLQRLAESPRRYGPLATLPAFGLTGAAAVAIMGGSAADVLAVAVVGTLVGATLEGSIRSARLRPLSELLGAVVASVAAGLFTRLLLPVDTGLVVLGSLIVLLPGLSLTTAITELASRHLVSGNARVAGAMITFASLALGAVGATVLLSAWPVPVVAGAPLAAWIAPATLPVAALSFVVLLQARIEDYGVVLAASAAAWAGISLASGMLRPPLDAGAAALALALLCNGLARLRDQPAVVPLIPGLFLLVPGSVGLRGLVHLLDADFMGGMEHAVTALLTAAAIAVGVLVGHAILPPRRAL